MPKLSKGRRILKKKPSVTELGERLFNKKCAKPSRLQQNGRFDLKNAPLWLVRYSEKEHRGIVP